MLLCFIFGNHDGGRLFFSKHKQWKWSLVKGTETGNSQPKSWGITDCPWSKISYKFQSNGVGVLWGFICKGTNGLWSPGPFSWTLTYTSQIGFLSVKITAKKIPWGPQNMELDRKFQEVWGGGVWTVKLLEQSMQLQTWQSIKCINHPKKKRIDWFDLLVTNIFPPQSLLHKYSSNISEDSIL